MSPLVLWERGLRVPILVWARGLDPLALRGLRAIARAPWARVHVAAMADAHPARAAPVGTVFATDHELVPGALGSDLGCGMRAVRLGAAPRPERRALERVLEGWTRAIPAGDACHAGSARAPDALLALPLSTGKLERARERLLGRHLGTLGGGNHFVELGRSAAGELWLLVHSGSRGLGGAVGDHHARATGGDALAALDTRRDEGAACAADLAFAWAVAEANRAAIARVAADVVREHLRLDFECRPPHSCAGRSEPDAPIDVPHNCIRREPWLGEDRWIHRKGAAVAPLGGLAPIPGSMGTASWIVAGRGAEASFGSCSHGAGRIVARGEVHRRLAPRAFERSMRGVVHPPHAHLIEEAPGAYRDVDQVVDDQRELVSPLVRLTPLVVLKG